MVFLISPVAVKAQAAPLTCAQGGVCLPGDIGPGGGLVFYVSSTPFKCGPNNADDCLYLEAAPKTWGGGSADPSYYWNKDAYEVDGISRDQSANMGADQFGLGYKNSRLMAALDSSETNSAVAARAYTGGSKSDWYLPTIAELGILCQYAHGQTPAVGNSCDYNQALNSGIPSAYEFSAAAYQSSSQSTDRGSAQWHQNFVFRADNNPAQQSTYEYPATPYPTRPIRAFTTVPTVADGNVNCGSGGTFAVLNKEVVSSTSDCSGAVTIPYGVTAVGYAAFWQRAITSVSIPNTVRSLGDNSFRQTSMTSVSIPASVETIGYLAFGTTFLTQLTFATNSNLHTIGLDAFQSSSFTSVTIPASVTTIGYNAFLGNVNLTEIIFGGIRPSGLPADWPWSAPAQVQVSAKIACGTVGYFVIQANVATGRHNCRGSVDIPSGVTAIANQAFDASPDWNGVGLDGNYDNSSIQTSITSLTIPNTVTSIGDYAFRALAVSSLAIPGSVSTLGIWAFAGSSLVDSLTISSSLTSIPDYAFVGLSNLRVLEIPSSVATIGGEAFNALNRLETLTISSSVTSLGSNAFAASQTVTTFNYCGSLTNQNFTTAGVGYLYAIRTCGVSAPGTPTSVSATISGNTSASVSFTAPSGDGGTPISSYTAISNPGNIRNSIYQSGSGTIIVSGLASGTDYTFTVVASNWGRSSSASIASNQIRTPGAPNAPTGVTATLNGANTIDVAFTAPINNGGTPITSYTATASPGGVTATINQAGSGTISISGLSASTAYSFTVVATNLVGNSVSSSSSNEVTTLSTPGMPTGVIATMTDSVTATITFTAPTSNGGATITGYTATSSPDGITGSVSQAGSGTITVSGLTPGTIYTFDLYATNIGGNSSTVQTNIVGAYFDGANGTKLCGTSGYFTIINKTVTNSPNCSGSVEIPYGVETIGEEAFCCGYEVTTVSFPSTLVTIEDLAFYGLNQLTALTIPNNVTTIGSSAFQNAYSLQTLVLGSGLTTIGSDAFRSAIVLISLTIPNSVTTLGRGAFRNNYSLASLTIGSGLTTIGLDAFRNAESLISLTIPNSVTTIGAGAFRDTGLQSFYYCGTLTPSTAFLYSGLDVILFSCPASTVPGAPSAVTATSTGSTTANVSFAAPADDGGEVITTYTLTSTPAGITQTLSQAGSGTFNVTGLVAGTSYTFTVKATNSIGDSAASSPSNSIPQSQNISRPSITIPSPRQQSKITDISISTIKAGTKSPVLVKGSFIETITNISIDGVNLLDGQWLQSSSEISFTLPALTAGGYVIQLYNGSAPVLKSLDITVEKVSTPKPTATPRPTRTPKPVVKATPTPKASTPALSKSPAATKQITIKCVKGKTVKFVKGTKPTCPTGYSKK